MSLFRFGSKRSSADARTSLEAQAAVSPGADAPPAARSSRRWWGLGLIGVVALGAFAQSQGLLPLLPPDPAAPGGGGIQPLGVSQADLVLPNGTSYTPPATVPMQAFTDTNEDGERVNRVDFYANGNVIGTFMGGNASFTWTNVPAGAYAIYAIAYSNQGGSLQSNIVNITVAAPTNQAPTVSLTVPTNGQVIAPGAVSMAANASDPDGSIQKVEFYVSDVLIAVDTAAPYATSWTAQSTGTYLIKARAFDNAGSASEVTHTVKVNTPPTVGFSAPVAGSVYQAPLNLTFQAETTDNSAVTQVAFYNGGTLLGTDTTAPFQYAWPNIPSGNYSLTAVATDDDGASTTSAAVAFTVNLPPSVSIASPASGTILGAPASPLVQANASDPDDAISKVEFYLGGVLQATDTTAPFAWQASNLAAGTYSLTARAFDTRGAATFSAANTLVVNDLPSVALTAPTAGTLVNAPGTLTLSANASDADGTITQVEFFAGSTLVAIDNAAPFTQVWSNVGAGIHTITAKATDNRGGVSTTAAVAATVNALPTVNLTAPAPNALKQAPADVAIEAAASDADDSISKVEFYQGGTLLNTDTTAPFAYNHAGMAAGVYTLTAKAYDSRGGVSTSNPSTLIVNSGPVVQITSPTDQAAFVLSGSVTVSANATDNDGTIAQVEFFAGSTSIGIDTQSPYSVPWTPGNVGDIAITAKATDNQGTVSTSPVVTLRVRADAFDLVGDQAPQSLLGQLPAHDPGVGKVAGSGGVSGGAATYEIPIVVPPGRRGMQPSLSLGYSSRAGNGIAGMGWSLSGLSSLHRCPQTLEQDGQIRAVQLDGSDRLCLDGQRLVLTSGTYGAINATYGTELESFVRVTQLGGTLTANNSYFKVERKSGEVAYYGSTSTAASAARVVPGGVAVPLTWLQVRSEDRVGNSIDYVYTDYGNGETLISSIFYTGFGATVGNRRVSFTYEARPSGGHANDRASSYLAGGLTRQTQRLTNIVTMVGTDPVRSWVLNYGNNVSTSTGRSLLQAVSDCAHDGSQWLCKAPTTFVWQQGPMTTDFKKLNLASQPFAASTADIMPLGDMDGDGATEVLVDSSAIVSLTPERTVRWSMPVPATYAIQNLAQSADFNQDGRVDFVARDTSTSRIVVRTWSGAPTDSSFATAFGNLIDTGITVAGDTSVVGGLVHVGDMDGDGRADLVLTRSESANAGSCARKVVVYRNTPNATTPTAAPTFPEVASHCMSVPHVGDVMYEGEQVQGVKDFNGDALPDILIESALEQWTTQVSQGRKLDRILFGTRTTIGYSLTSRSFASVFPAAQPRDAHENKSGLFALWMDANGDGLDDWLYVGFDKVWKLRYNRGGVLSTVYSLGTSAGLTGCGSPDSQSQSLCAHVWTPWQAQHLRPADVDGDGRSELLFPSGFAANVCVWKPEQVDQCTSMGLGSVCTQADPERWICPEDPVTGAAPALINGVVNGVDVNGNYDPASVISAITISTHANGVPDYSTYTLSALRIVEAADGTPVISTTPTSLLSGPANLPQDDLYGDGHTDRLLKTTPPFGLADQYGIPVVRGAGANATPIPAAQSPRLLPGGFQIFGNELLIMEGTGPAAAKNLDGLTPQTQDVLGMATDGLGVQTVWSYAPLASKAGRSASQVPLYTVPMNAAQRYIDERHIYFTSSMNVVAQMSQTDGVGGFRTLRYGYGEAVYHTQGRGFQGFRTIVEEDDITGLRTTTTFHQKFPLTSQPERIVVNPLNRPGEDGAISREAYTWRCNLVNRADTAACTPTYGTPKKYFPFLDIKESWTYDATTAAIGGTTPAILGYTQEVAAADTNCVGTFATASGFDANGNLRARTIHRRDLGSGSASGTANRLDRQCVSEANTFTTTTADWWLDKLTKTVVKTKVTWDSTQHALPASTSNPFYSVTTDYVWNANRTLQTETVQNTIANQQRVTAYTYPTTNYGLPTGVGVTASGDPNGSRSVGTSYSADGYFPQAVANALGHSATTVVRARDGQPASVTDANGIRTLTDYDAFGFAVKQRVRGATDSVMVMPDRHMAVSACLPSSCWPGERYWLTTVQDGHPVQVARFDVLGRTTSTTQTQLDGGWTQAFTTYTARGQVAQQSEPTRGAPPVWTTFQYADILGRMTQKTVPKQAQDGRGDLVTRYSYAGRTTTIQVCGSNDAGTGNCLNLSRTTDSLGRYVETRDALNGRTRFWYEANGNVAAIEDAKAVVTRAAYNAIGQRSSVNDPNQGNWSFVYNALGEVISQTDARSIVTTMSYDKLGRPTSRNATIDVTGDNVADTVADSWTYDPAGALGQPLTEQRNINGTTERRSTLTYDSLARPVQTDVLQALTTGTQTYTLKTKYDSYYGRPVGQRFPNGETLQVVYGQYGDALAEQDPITGSEYRRLNSVNARGQATQETFGNGVVLNPQYHVQTGQLTELRYTKNGSDVRKLGYGYDVFGNLKQQTLNGGQSQEDYSYDQLHRLVQSIRSGAASGTVSYGFDAVGNFSKKTDFSANTSNAYVYTGGTCGGGANAVRSVTLANNTTRTFCYDANGNLTSDNAGLAIKYDHMNLPTVAQRGANRDDFRYGADGMRTRSWGADGSRVYLPGYEHKLDTNETKVYVGDYAVITSGGGNPRKVEYLLKDRLGSVDAITNSSGTVTETRGYDAFGKPRSGTWADLNPAKMASTAVTPKGFTQHEHLNQLELIHMNGRVFDYNLGRFTGVDPFIQFPLNSQSLNPYSYILNNPLSGTDPTGYCAAATGSHIKSCETYTATAYNSAGDVIGKATTVGQAGALQNAASAGIGTLSNGSVGAQTPSGVCAGGRKSEAAQPQDRGDEERKSTARTVTDGITNVLAPNVAEWGRRGEPAESGWDVGSAAGKWVYNAVLGAEQFVNPISRFNPFKLPPAEFTNEELGTAAVLDTIVVASGAVGGIRGAASRTASVAKSVPETFYRSMSQAHYDQLLATGKLPATAETFISPTKAFAANYDGVLVQFNVRGGTTQALRGIGVRDFASNTALRYGDLPTASKGWTSSSALFKTEGGANPQINIGLGRGAALDVFNSNILNFRAISK
jgi:RHS repeat-associated protein